MSEPISLKQIERKAFRLNMADGLLDIQVGLVMLILGAAALLGEAGVGSWIMLIAIVVAVAVQGLLQVVRRNVSQPRAGRIKFGPARKRRIRTLAGIILAAVLISFLVVGGLHFAARNNDALSGSRVAVWSAVMFFAVLVLVIFAGMTYYLDEPRLMVHGLLIFAAVPAYFALQEYTDITAALPYMIVGSIATGMGIVLLVRFLKKYPKPPAEELAHGEE